MERERIARFYRFLIPEYILAIAAAICILIALSLISTQNYLLFHSITEIVTIAIAFSIFILVWNNRGIITDTFFLIIGISFLFTGSIDFLHTLAYKGMGVFPGSTADLPTQLWIAARYFQSIAFLVATLFIGKPITRDRRYDIAIIIAACTAACGLLLASIFIWQDFPTCFIEGIGLTPFKIVSEYIISLILGVTVVILYYRRQSFDPEVWRFLIAAQIFLVLGELAFTTYASVYGFTNMLGHLFKLISFYLFYRAIIVVGITRPYDLLFRDLVENINDVIFTIDPRGRIVYVSPVISRLYGYNPDEVTGQDFIRFVHQDDRSRFQEWFTQSKDGKRGENEFRISTQDGRERYVRTSVCPLVRSGRAGMFTCTLADITERRRSETVLAHVNRSLRMLSNSNHALVHITDETTLMNEVCRIAVEDGGYRMAWIGFAGQDEAKTVRPVAHAGFESGYIESANVTWADSERGRSPSGSAIRTGQPCITRNIFVDPAFAPWREAAIERGYKSSIALPLINEGQIFGVLVIYSVDTDAFDTKEVNILTELADDLAFGITALRTRARREQAEEALQESEEKYRTLVETTGTGFVIIDTDGRVLDANPEYVRLSGHAGLDEIIGRKVTEWTAKDDSEKNAEAVRQCMRDGFIRNFEINYTDASGHITPIEINAAVLRSGTTVQIHTLCRDITERKQAEDALRKSGQEWQTTFNAITDAVFLLDDEGRIIRHNRAFETSTGKPAGEIDGRYCFEVLHGTAHPFEGCPMVKAKKSRQRESLELKIGNRWFIAALDPVFSETGEISGGVHLLIDITERKQAEDALRASEERYRHIFNKAPLGFMQYDKEGTILDCNEEFADIMGAPRDRLIGFNTLQGLKDGPARDALIAALETGTGYFEGPYISVTGGRKVTMRALHQRLNDHQGNSIGAISVFEDITERKQVEEEVQKKSEELLAAYEEISATEEELRENYEDLREREDVIRESEAQLRSILHASPVMQFSIDKDHHVISWNKALEIYSGIRAEDVLGTDGQWRAMYPEKRPLLADILVDQTIHLLPDWYQEKFSRSRFVDEGYEATDFFLYMGVSGKWLHATAVPIRDTRGVVIGAIETLEDITERKNAEDALRESEKFLTSVVENIPDMIFVKDARDLRFVRFNKAGEDLLGFSREDLCGKNDYDFFPEDEAAFFTRNDRQVLENQQLVDIPEEKIQTRHKGTRILHTKKIPIIDESGKPGYLMGISEDITERKMAQDALNRATRKLSLLNSITFSDIQNAVFSLSAYMELEKKVPMDEKLQQYLDKQIRLIKTITESLKFANNYQNLGLKPPAWQNVLQSFLLGISHMDISKLSRQLNVDGLEIYADPLLENVFFTLAENIVVHGITATEFALRYQESADGLSLFFEDNGVGIRNDLKETIFGRQYGEKRGMGLFLVREILSITGITIRETGEPGKGARFEMMVPNGAYRFTGTQQKKTQNSSRMDAKSIIM